MEQTEYAIFEKGFSLVELMIAMTIAMIIAIPSMRLLSESAMRVAQNASELQLIATQSTFQQLLREKSICDLNFSNLNIPISSSSSSSVAYMTKIFLSESKSREMSTHSISDLLPAGTSLESIELVNWRFTDPQMVYFDLIMKVKIVDAWSSISVRRIRARHTGGTAPKIQECVEQQSSLSSCHEVHSVDSGIGAQALCAVGEVVVAGGGKCLDTHIDPASLGLASWPVLDSRTLWSQTGDGHVHASHHISDGTREGWLYDCCGGKFAKPITPIDSNHCASWAEAFAICCGG